MTQANYFLALEELDEMLSGSQPASFKRAVFLVETTFLDNRITPEEFDREIDLLVSLAEFSMSTNELIYENRDKEAVEKYGAVFLAMTDTISYLSESGSIETHFPFTYDFDDFWGEKDWTKMFVSKLLKSGKGNCHSLPFLYKILTEEMGETAYLAMAPNHTYIKLWTEKTGWFNTELTSATFPIDAWIMASGYVHVNAVQNGLYMDTLSTEQSIAVAVTDLALGYQKRFGKKDNPEFILQCLDLALKHYPNYINALLLKAETLKVIYERMMEEYGTRVPSELFDNPAYKNHFLEMEKLYFMIHQLGYRKMPKEMYLSWLNELNEEKEKYKNPKLGNLNTK